MLLSSRFLAVMLLLSLFHTHCKKKDVLASEDVLSFKKKRIKKEKILFNISYYEVSQTDFKLIMDRLVLLLPSRNKCLKFTSKILPMETFKLETITDI